MSSDNLELFVNKLELPYKYNDIETFQAGYLGRHLPTTSGEKYHRG